MIPNVGSKECGLCFFVLITYLPSVYLCVLEVSSDLGEICFTIMYTFLQFGEYEFHVSMTKVSCSGQVIQHNSKAVDVLSAILIIYHACEV